MPATLLDSLRLVRPYFPQGLVAPEALARLERAAVRLPFNYQVGFESRLGPGSAQVDLAQYFSQGDGSRSLLATYARQPPAAHDWAWARLADFCGQWADPAGALHEAVSHVWLEYDLPDLPGGPAEADLPAPGVFIALPDELAATARLSVLETIIGLLARDTPLLATVRGRLEASVAGLPAEAVVYTLGVMLSRGSQAVRLPIHHIAIEHVPGYLKQIGWPGALDAVAPLAERFAPLADRIAVDLDIGEQVWPTLGLELHLGTEAFGGPRWQQALDWLVSAEWCTREKRDGLLRWPGIQTSPPDGVSWPAPLLMDSLRRGLVGHWAVSRQLNHLKLFYRPGQAVSAKVYWGYLLEWVKRAQ